MSDFWQAVTERRDSRTSGLAYASSNLLACSVLRCRSCGVSASQRPAVVPSVDSLGEGVSVGQRLPWRRHRARVR